MGQLHIRLLSPEGFFNHFNGTIQWQLQRNLGTGDFVGIDPVVHLNRVRTGRSMNISLFEERGTPPDARFFCVFLNGFSSKCEMGSRLHLLLCYLLDITDVDATMIPRDSPREIKNPEIPTDSDAIPRDFGSPNIPIDP